MISRAYVYASQEAPGGKYTILNQDTHHTLAMISFGYYVCVLEWLYLPYGGCTMPWCHVQYHVVRGSVLLSLNFVLTTNPYMHVRLVCILPVFYSY